MRVLLLLALIAFANAALQPPNAPNPDNNPFPMKELIKSAAKESAATGSLVFFDKAGKLLKKTANPADFDQIPKETEAVIFVADPTHFVDAFLASAAKFATDHANFRIMLANSAVIPIGDKKPAPVPNIDALPALNFIPLPKNLGLFGARFKDDNPKALADFVQSLQQGIPAEPSAATAATGAAPQPNKKKLLLLELQSKSHARAPWNFNVWPDIGTWRYWFDGANFPNHHVSHNRANFIQNHSTRHGTNWHFFGNTGTWSPATPVNERYALYIAFWDWALS